MSAICGFFNTSGAPVSYKTGAAMMERLRVCSEENSRQRYVRHVFMGCRCQPVTPEAEYDNLPLVDGITGNMISADAIIDNRDELLEELGIPRNEWETVGNGRLILEAYSKWGGDCPGHLAGDFAFAIYDSGKDELFCARDHAGKRTLYYTFDHGCFAFCTTVKPLLVLDGPGAGGLNDPWMADYLSFGGPLHEVDSSQTPYKGVMQLLPASIIKVGRGYPEQKRYWSPLNRRELRLGSDGEYEEAFREVFFEAVKCRIRCAGNVGLMLSGGLDSGSVACVAAKFLEEQGKKLYAFSSIPFPGYVNRLPGNVLPDESEYIETVKAVLRNMDHTYCRSENRNSITDADRFIELMEQPYKFVENFFWVNEIMSQASGKGCGIMLNGQFGNLTVSFGDIITCLITMFRKMKLLSVAREISGYSRLMDVNPLRVAGSFIKKMEPPAVNNLRSMLMRKGPAALPVVPVNPELAVKCNVDERFRQFGIGRYEDTNKDVDDVRKVIAGPRFFSHIGATDTKLSLAYGVQVRDPTMDKRVMEFCFSVPMEQYVRKGCERSLIRRSMSGMLPDTIRLNYRSRGMQSADWLQRLLPVWGGIRRELEQSLKDDGFRHYIDAARIKSALDNIGDSPGNKSAGEARMLVVCLIFGRFLRMHALKAV